MAHFNNHEDCRGSHSYEATSNCPAALKESCLTCLHSRSLSSSSAGKKLTKPDILQLFLNVQMKLKSIGSELLDYMKNNEESEQNLEILDNNRWIPFNGEIRNSKPFVRLQLMTPKVLKYLCTSMDHSDWFRNGSQPKPGPSRRHDSFRLGGRHRVLNSTWVDSLADNIK